MGCVIGIDFDNTLVSYDDVIYRVAAHDGLIPLDVGKRKKEIRDRIRQLPGGEIEWQKLQAVVYGSRMGEAELIDGVKTFFELCKRYKVKLFIISHKTEYAKLDETATNLWLASLTWMERNKFFEPDGLGLTQGDVYFESTRNRKIERIRDTGCTHFIDDLEELFLEDSFPTTVEKILYTPEPDHVSLNGFKVFNSWEAISDYFFGRGV